MLNAVWKAVPYVVAATVAIVGYEVGKHLIIGDEEDYEVVGNVTDDAELTEEIDE